MLLNIERKAKGTYSITQQSLVGPVCTYVSNVLKVNKPISKYMKGYFNLFSIYERVM